MEGSSRRPQQERVWQAAGGKRREARGNYHHQIKRRSWCKSVTSFFVSNLPEGTKAMDMKECFEEYGRVVDAYVAAKKDKTGYHFGFVRFEGMEAQLKEVNLNNARLSVNLAKYDVEGKANKEVGGSPGESHPGSSGWPTWGRRRRELGQYGGSGGLFLHECPPLKSTVFPAKNGSISAGGCRGKANSMVRHYIGWWQRTWRL
ncbi:hypothetical protein L1987_65633 [Smallanthus sonchifolius]|uniref:Uncharacterized protein n=1 Tax=Smallanthus sonchifolius TaxID=185202 RepID=A0ACB9BUV1_9ASTR|nr:hypothetical protein L1987_65633 [Smallanthus sonchifolius]